MSSALWVSCNAFQIHDWWKFPLFLEATYSPLAQPSRQANCLPLICLPLGLCKGLWKSLLDLRCQRSLHILAVRRHIQALQPHISISLKPQELDNLQQLRRHHRYAKLECSKPKTDGPHQPFSCFCRERCFREVTVSWCRFLHATFRFWFLHLRWWIFFRIDRSSIGGRLLFMATGV